MLPNYLETVMVTCRSWILRGYLGALQTNPEDGHKTKSGRRCRGSYQSAISHAELSVLGLWVKSPSLPESCSSRSPRIPTHAQSRIFFESRLPVQETEALILVAPTHPGERLKIWLPFRERGDRSSRESRWQSRACRSGLREVLACALGRIIWLPREDPGKFWTGWQQHFRLPSSHYSEPQLENIDYDDFYHVRTTNI